MNPSIKKISIFPCPEPILAICCKEFCVHPWIQEGGELSSEWWSLSHILSSRKINPSEFTFANAINFLKIVSELDIEISAEGKILKGGQELKEAIREMSMENLLHKSGFIQV